MRRELFVYWRVAGDADAALAAAARLHAGLRASEPALVARLYRKADATGCTLMETYALPGAGIDATLLQRIESQAAHQLSPWCAAGARHVEVFEACS